MTFLKFSRGFYLKSSMAPQLQRVSDLFLAAVACSEKTNAFVSNEAENSKKRERILRANVNLLITPFAKLAEMTYVNFYVTFQNHCQMSPVSSSHIH